MRVIKHYWLIPFGVLAVLAAACTSNGSAQHNTTLPSPRSAVTERPGQIKAISEAAARDRTLTRDITLRGKLRVGCATQVLGRSGTTDYVWIFCLAPGGGNISVPAVVQTSEHGTTLTVTNIQIPDDGDGFDASVKRLFPTGLVTVVEQQTGINFQTLQAEATSALR